MEHPARLASVTHGVEGAQGLDAAREDPAAALAIGRLLRVVGQRADDLDAVFGEEVRQVGEAGLELDGEVVADHHLAAQGVAAADHLAESRVQLGSAPRDVQRVQLRRARQHVQATVHDVVRHHLRAGGRGIDMAVMAGLVAALAHVHLQGGGHGRAQLAVATGQASREARKRSGRRHIEIFLSTLWATRPWARAMPARREAAACMASARCFMVRPCCSAVWV